MGVALRPGRAEDAFDIAELVNMAGDGLPYFVWSSIAGDNDDPLDIGAEFVGMDTSLYSWRKTLVAETDGAVAGCLVTSLIPDPPEPAEAAVLPYMEPLEALMREAPGTCHVHFVATFPENRRQGIGAVLMKEAGAKAGPNGVSLTVASDNVDALAFYDNLGFAERSRRAAVTDGWTDDAFDWVLLVKPA